MSKFSIEIIGDIESQDLETMFTELRDFIDSVKIRVHELSILPSGGDEEGYKNKCIRDTQKLISELVPAHFNGKFRLTVDREYSEERDIITRRFGSVSIDQVEVNDSERLLTIRV